MKPPAPVTSTVLRRSSAAQAIASCVREFDDIAPGVITDRLEQLEEAFVGATALPFKERLIVIVVAVEMVQIRGQLGGAIEARRVDVGIPGRRELRDVGGPEVHRYRARDPDIEELVADVVGHDRFSNASVNL
jgi:hypothetical protein